MLFHPGFFSGDFIAIELVYLTTTFLGGFLTKTGYLYGAAFG